MLFLLIDNAAAALAPILQMRAPAPAMGAATTPVDDWGGLPAAIRSSKCGAINSKIVKAPSWDAVLKLAKDNEQSLNGVNVATALHNVAKLTKFKRAEREALQRDPRYMELMSSAAARADECSARAVADILWSCATLSDFPPALLKPLLMQVANCLQKGSFEPQHLSIMVWAFATLECKPVKLLEQIEERALEHLSGFNTQNCANILHGFAKLKYPAEKLYPAISSTLASSDMVGECKPVEVADLAYAVAMLGDQHPTSAPPLLTRLTERARESTDLAHFSSRQIVMMLWSYAKLGLLPQPEVLREWVARARSAHEQRPLMDSDARNLEAVLLRMGEDVAWLHPKKSDVEANP